MMRSRPRRILDTDRTHARHLSFGLRLGLSFCALLFALPIGCAPSTKNAGALKAALAAAPQSTPVQSVPSAIRGQIQALGSIPYDGFTLPIVCPDGRHFAVQLGDNIDFRIRLAQTGAAVPRARVATYRIEPSGLLRLSESDDGILLGRGASFAGCVCENPRPSGARAIGILLWGKSEPEWIVDDGRTNAFASLAPDATLAWSSRDAAGGAWSLCIRVEGNEDDIIIPAPDGASWIFPVAVNRSCVCAVLLRDGVASFACIDPSDPKAASMPPALFRISDRVDARIAFQMFSPQQGLDAVSPSGQILFFDPTSRGVRSWDPKTGAFAQLKGRSLAVSFTDPTHFAALLGGEVRVQSMADGTDVGTKLLDSVAVPRRLPSQSGAQGVLLVAPEGRTLRLAALRAVEPVKP